VFSLSPEPIQDIGVDPHRNASLPRVGKHRSAPAVAEIV
jgi:hypothetical protein